MYTDTQVFQDIVDEFKNSPVLHYAKLGLHVENGVVTISGRVNSFAERKAVERAAERVAGIKTLILEIRAAAFPTTVIDSNAGTPKDTARRDYG
jgi:osmotically-inducible protein OsmY